MVRRTSHEDASCAVARPLDAIGDGWSLLIIRDAFDGLRRFGQFQKSLGLAKNILSARLQSLVARGILATVPASDGSPYREYVLTDKGRGLFPVLVALRQWGEDYFFRPEETRARLVDRICGRPIARLEIRSADGRLLGPEDTEIAMLPGDHSVGDSVPVRSTPTPGHATAGHSASSCRPPVSEAGTTATTPERMLGKG